MAVSAVITGASVMKTVMSLVDEWQNSMPSEVSEKTRYLHITLMNMSSNQCVEVKESWFVLRYKLNIGRIGCAS